jgi:type II secretory ATPase GspE/PulE/Tfp pilus assembly ATPase PilB-like protein
MSNVLRETILRDASPLEIKQGAVNGGMRSLRQAAIAKFKQGIIPLEQVLTMTVGDDEL